MMGCVRRFTHREGSLVSGSLPARGPLAFPRGLPESQIRCMGSGPRPFPGDAPVPVEGNTPVPDGDIPALWYPHIGRDCGIPPDRTEVGYFPARIGVGYHLATTGLGTLQGQDRGTVTRPGQDWGTHKPGLLWGTSVARTGYPRPETEHQSEYLQWAVYLFFL